MLGLTDLSAQAVAIKAMDSLLDDLQPGMKVSFQEGTLSLCAKTTSPPPPPSPPSPPLTNTPPTTPHPEHHPAPAPSPPPAQQIEEQIEIPQQIAQQQNGPRHTYNLRRRQPDRELAQGERNQGLAARSAPSRRKRRRVRAAPLRAAGPAEALNAVEQENPVVEEENPVDQPTYDYDDVPEVTQFASSTADQNVNFPVTNSPNIADPSPPDVNAGMAGLNKTIELNKTQILKGRLLTVVTPSVLFDVLLDTLPTQGNPVDRDQIMPDFEKKLNAKLGGNPVDGLGKHFDQALQMLQSDAYRNAVNVQTDNGKIWIVLPNADPDVMQHLENLWRLKKQRSQLEVNVADK